MKVNPSWIRKLITLPPYLVLASCLIVTAASAYSVFSYTQAENASRLHLITEQTRNRIQTRMDHYESALIQMRAFLISSPSVTRSQFQNYVENLLLMQKYPGIQGLGYTVRIQHSDLAAHIESVRQEGFSSYTVWPPDPREEYFSILYLEPFDWRNQRAFGFDMFTEPVRREAMARARDTGMPAKSATVELVQETEEAAQPGFLLYVPVYEGGVVPSTEEGRRQSLLGFVYAPFRSKELFDAIFQNNFRTYADVHVEIFDGAADTAATPFYSSESLFGPFEHDAGLDPEITEIAKGGHTWTISVSPRPTFNLASTRYLPIGVGIAGTLFSFLLFSILTLSQRHLIKEAASKETLEQINRVSRNISSELDLKKLVQEVTDAATALSKAQFGAFFYNSVDSTGETYTLYTISGAAREAFSRFPMPRKTEIFAPTFDGKGIVRSDDITKDPRYGKNAPRSGMPEGHLPVRSYLAVPVISRSGEVLGGLFFGHEKPAVFGKREEEIVAGIASHASVSIDNARLFQKSQEAVSARDQFLSICSHELKTPITSLKLQAQIASRQLAKFGTMRPDQFSSLCSTMDQQLNQLTKLVDDMLDITRIETGKLSLAKEKVDLSELTAKVISRFSPQAKARGVNVTFQEEVDLWVDIDPDRISQVIMNLLSNALKYGNDQPIEVSTHSRNGSAVLSVRDKGMGISEKDQQRIFNRFERVVPYHNISGLGLGLFISRQIMDAHKGKIQVKSEEGFGSVFTIEFPLAEARSVSLTERASEMQAGA